MRRALGRLSRTDASFLHQTLRETGTAPTGHLTDLLAARGVRTSASSPSPDPERSIGDEERAASPASSAGGTSAAPHPRYLTATAAALESRRWDGLVWVPGYVFRGVEKAARELYGGRLEVRDLRGAADRLAVRMRRASRTPSEGGLIPPGLLLPRTRETAAAEAAAERRRLLSDLAARGLPTEPGQLMVFDDTELVRHVSDTKQLAELVPSIRYDERDCIAYAASRAPACFAAARKALDELKRRHPDVRPRTALDFGSGPGSTLWAIDDVFGLDSFEGVLAVEPSPDMRNLARTIMAERLKGSGGDAGAPLDPAPAAGRVAKSDTMGLKSEKASSSTSSTSRAQSMVSSTAASTAPSQANGLPERGPLRWVPRLGYLRQGSAADSRYRSHDLVTASYCLTEIPDPEDRRKIILDLWDRTADTLILIEPGSPYGFALIREARALLLDKGRKEARRAGRLAELQAEALRMGLMAPAPPTDGAAIAVATALPLPGGAAPPLGSLVFTGKIPKGVDPRHALDIRTALSDPRARRLALSPPGVHVVAPCPGEGECPIRGSTEKWFCHFKQRFERPELARLLKAEQTREPHKAKPRGFQDERFSYIILRRGPRPGSSPSSPAPQLVIDQWRPMSDYQPLRPSDTPEQVLRGALGRGGLEELGLGSDDGEKWSEAAAAAHGLSGMGGGGADGGVEEEEEEEDGADIDLLIERALRGGEGGKAAEERLMRTERGPDAADEEREGEAASGGPGLEDLPKDFLLTPKLIRQLSEDSKARSSGGSPGAGSRQEDQSDVDDSDESAFSARPADAAVGVLRADGHVDLHLRSWLASEEVQPGSGPDKGAARVDAWRWPRLVRPSRKSGGHVLMELCTPPPPPPPEAFLDSSSPAASLQALRPPPNEIRRYVVPKGLGRRLGFTPYRIARRNMWGDLFPSHYLPHLSHWAIGEGWNRIEHRKAPAGNLPVGIPSDPSGGSAEAGSPTDAASPGSRLLYSNVASFVAEAAAAGLSIGPALGPKALKARRASRRNADGPSSEGRVATESESPSAVRGRPASEEDTDVEPERAAAGPAVRGSGVGTRGRGRAGRMVGRSSSRGR